MKHQAHLLRRILCATLTLCCLLTLGRICMPAAQAAGMTASVVTAPVTLNGQKIDNSSAQYPLLLYRNITYFPMTYHLSRFMGITTDWNNDTRTLKIAAGAAQGSYVPDTGHAGTGGYVTVTRAAYQIYINDAYVDNSQEDWPILNYNGVTYFPLTWDYAVESFGWNYQWDEVNGLRIDTKTTPQQETTTGNPALDSALAILNANYLAGGAYTGTLTGPESSETFRATVAVTRTPSDVTLTLTAEPFVFFTKGAKMMAIYYTTQGGLSGKPLIQSIVVTEPFEDLPVDPAPVKEYLGRSFMDCQFTGERVKNITASRQISADDTSTVWELTVAYTHEENTGYTVRFSVNTATNAVEWLLLSAGGYTLRMTPGGNG